MGNFRTHKAASRINRRNKIRIAGGDAVLTVRQAAGHAEVSESLIYAWCNDGTLSHSRIGRKGKRGHIRIAIEDLEIVMASFRVQPSVATPKIPLTPSRPRPQYIRMKP